MKVLVDGVCVRYLEAGDLIGKHQLFLDHITGSPERVGLQAESTCTLKSGLSRHSEVESLQDRFAKDFSLLSAHRMGSAPVEAAMNDLSRVVTTTRRSSLPSGQMNDLSWLGASSFDEKPAFRMRRTSSIT